MKEAWDILKTTHEGTKTVNVYKIKKMTKKFENLTMNNYEFFNKFYCKLNNIVNTSYNLGEKMSDSKFKRKILRYLSKIFQPKVTVIEESKYIDTLKLDELVRNQTTIRK